MNKHKPKLIIFASGTKTGGGSGFENLVQATKTGILDADIVAVISNHANGGVKEKADRLGIKFVHFPKPWTAENYQKIVKDNGVEWIALSGWLKLVKGLDPAKTINIHPGPLPEYGGSGMYGHYVHEKVFADFKAGKIKNSAVTMHFVTEEYDEGPIFFQLPVPILANDTPETLAKRVNEKEHEYQPKLTNLVVHEKIKWDGKNKNSLIVPEGYKYHQIKIN